MPKTYTERMLHKNRSSRTNNHKKYSPYVTSDEIARVLTALEVHNIITENERKNLMLEGLMIIK